MLSCLLIYQSCSFWTKFAFSKLLPAMSHITSHLGDIYEIIFIALSLSISAALLIPNAPLGYWHLRTCFVFYHFSSYFLLRITDHLCNCFPLFSAIFKVLQGAHIYGTIWAFHLYLLLSWAISLQAFIDWANIYRRSSSLCARNCPK